MSLEIIKNKRRTKTALAVGSVSRLKVKFKVTRRDAATFPGCKVRGRPKTRRPEVLSLLLSS